jgi:hypothetical protein
MRLRQMMTAALLAGSLAAGSAAAQDPYAEYNLARAYHHFMTSPYRTRTWSGTVPGYAAPFSTPLEYGTAWRAPGYLHVRISPRGSEGYFIPGQEGITVLRPAVIYLPPWAFAPFP